MPEIPFAFQWEISEDELLPLKESENGYLYSTIVTNIPEFEYYLKIYPNGNNVERRGETKISFHLDLKNVKKVEADYIITIESANYSRKMHSVFDENKNWGLYIGSTKDLFDPEKEYIIDGKFIVKYCGIFKFETENAIPAAIKEQKWIGGALGDEFWAKMDTKDFTIITADGKAIYIHKSVLDVRSEVFTAMFKSNMKESKENKVTIPYFPFIVVETAFKIIYDCNFTTNLSIDELMSLLQFFDKYLLQPLKDKVEPFLISQISVANVCRLTNGSIITNSFKLKQKCMEFLSAAFASKTPLADFDDLNKDILFEVVKNSFYQTLETEEEEF